jgi:hypothetical protein
MSFPWRVLAAMPVGLVAVYYTVPMLELSGAAQLLAYALAVGTLIGFVFEGVAERESKIS